MTNKETIHKLIMFRRILERGVFPVGYIFDAEPFDLAISALENQEHDRWRPCNEKPEYDFQNVLVRWHDKRKGCEKDYYIFEGYVVNGIWCGLFEDADISDFEPIEWKPLEPYTEEES